MGAEVEIMERASLIPMGEALLGRVLNAFGEPLDGQPLPASVPLRSFYSEPPNPLHRPLLYQDTAVILKGKFQSLTEFLLIFRLRNTDTGTHV